MNHKIEFFVAVIFILQRIVVSDSDENVQPAIEMEADYTYCASDLTRLAEGNRRFVSEILTRIEPLEIILKTIKRLLLAKEQDSSPKEIVDNPLLSYNMIRTTVKDGEAIENYFEDAISILEKSQNAYKEFIKEVSPPTEYDLIESMESILRLRHTYSLNVEKFSKGHIRSIIKMNGSLSTEDLFDIGSHGLEIGMFSDSVDFLESAFQAEINDSQREKVKSKLEQAVSEHDDHFHTYQMNPNQLDPEEILSLFNQSLGSIFTETFRNRQPIKIQSINQNKELDTIATFEKLCRNENVKTLTDRSKLKCYSVIPSHHAYWKLNPLKIEVFHDSPQIIQIYEVLTNTEIDNIVKEARSSLKRSKLYRISENGTLTSGTNRIRTSSSTWIRDKESKEFHFINEKVERITGYRVSGSLSSEDLQIASYRGGGHYSLHTDGLFEDKIRHQHEQYQFDMGDRIATFMIYLSDVALGGNTVFPLLKVGIRPVRNSAILWENLNEDGSINLQTLHGGCPVLYGVKEVANKWIRSNDQMFTEQNCRRPGFDSREILK